MKKFREYLKEKELDLIRWSDISVLFDEYKINFTPYTSEEINESIEALGIKEFPKELYSYYKSIGKTPCGITFLNNNIPLKKPIELLDLKEVHIQEVNSKKYLIFARNYEKTVALFYDVNDDSIVYSTDNKVVTFEEYFNNLKQCIIHVDETLETLYFYSLKEKEKLSVKHKAQEYRKTLLQKDICKVSAEELSKLLDLYRIERNPYRQSDLRNICFQLKINDIPQHLKAYYLYIGECVIQDAVPTKINNIADLECFIYQDIQYLKIINDEHTKQEILVKLEDIEEENPRIYRYQNNMIIDRIETLQKYFDYFFHVIISSEEWINYWSKI